MSFAHLDLKGFVSWCLFSPLVLIYFLPPLLQSPLIPEGKDWIDTSQLGLRVPRILTLHVCCGSLYLFHLLQEGASLVMAKEAADVSIVEC